MLTQGAQEALAKIQAMLRDPEHEERVREFDRSQRALRACERRVAQGAAKAGKESKRG
jgi:hypothetical protein